MSNEKYLLVVSGPSGSGKDTVVSYLANNYNNIEIAVSATTRDVRAGEKNGVNYFFITNDEFENKIKENQLLEYAKYCDNYYGTLRSEVDDRINSSITVILVIEVQGAAKIKALYPDCTTVFIRPPSYVELERRLKGRGTESDDKIAARLKRAVEEMEFASEYDYVVVNDDIEKCADEIHNILISLE